MSLTKSAGKLVWVQCATVLLVLLLIIVSVLIGWKRGASFSSQSYGVVDVKPMTFGQSNRLVSIYYLDFSVVFWRLPSWFLSWNLICTVRFLGLCVVCRGQHAIEMQISMYWLNMMHLKNKCLGQLWSEVHLISFVEWLYAWNDSSFLSAGYTTRTPL